MGYKRLKPAQKLATLPGKFIRGLFGSDLMDWSSSVGMAYATEVLRLAQDLGGWDSLSWQEQALVENAAYQRLKTREFQLADLQGKPLPFERGSYTNKANVLLGHLKTLGLKRQQRDMGNLEAHFARQEAAVESAP